MRCSTGSSTPVTHFQNERLVLEYLLRLWRLFRHGKNLELIPVAPSSRARDEPEKHEAGDPRHRVEEGLPEVSPQVFEPRLGQPLGSPECAESPTAAIDSSKGVLALARVVD
jgi:hypothetical protein